MVVKARPPSRRVKKLTFAFAGAATIREGRFIKSRIWEQGSA